MYVIAISNEKGGVAKTTTTTSLGAVLVENQMRTLLIDLDPQANLSLSFGIEPDKIRHSMANVLLEKKTFHEAIIPTKIDGLDIIPSNSELGLIERFLAIQQNYQTLLRQSLIQSQLEYDFVIMDCPPFLGLTTLNALTASNLLLIPTQAEFFSIYALRNLMNVVRRVRNEYNASLTYRLLLTMYDRRNRSHRILSEQLRKNFSNGVLETIIEVDTKLRESPLVGLPITYHAPKSRATLQYRALAQEILTYVKETTVQPA